MVVAVEDPLEVIPVVEVVVPAVIGIHTQVKHQVVVHLLKLHLSQEML